MTIGSNYVFMEDLETPPPTPPPPSPEPPTPEPPTPESPEPNIPAPAYRYQVALRNCADPLDRILLHMLFRIVFPSDHVCDACVCENCDSIKICAKCDLLEVCLKKTYN